MENIIQETSKIFLNEGLKQIIIANNVANRFNLTGGIVKAKELEEVS